MFAFLLIVGFGILFLAGMGFSLPLIGLLVFKGFISSHKEFDIAEWLVAQCVLGILTILGFIVGCFWDAHLVLALFCTYCALIIINGLGLWWFFFGFKGN